MIDFYDEYPRIGWDLYSRSSLSAWAKEQLYPVLRRCIAGKSKSEAANTLIDFVQTAFEYKTDEEQFGYERPLFADETLYYPYSDCEDRAIFYSILVRDLLGLDVVLLHYPNHLATAVSFGEEIAGDYLMLDDRKYLVAILLISERPSETPCRSSNKRQLRLFAFIKQYKHKGWQCYPLCF